MLIDCDLRAFGLGFDADGSHPRIATFAAEHLLEFAGGSDVIGIAERTQCGRDSGNFSLHQLRGCGFVEVSGFAQQDGVSSLVERQLRGSHFAAVFAVHINVGAHRTAADGKCRHQRRETDGD